MEPHQKLEKLAKIRKRREDKALKENKRLQQELYEYECSIDEHKQKMQDFLEDRGVQIHSLQNKMRTEAMNGQSIEAYLLMKEDTKKRTEEFYEKLEELTKNYYPLLDKVNESYKKWNEVNISRVRLENVVKDKTELFVTETAQAEEMSRYNDFFGKKTPHN